MKRLIAFSALQGLLRPIFGAPQTHNCCKLTFFDFVWLHNALINKAMHFFIRFSQCVQMIQADEFGSSRPRNREEHGSGMSEKRRPFAGDAEKRVRFGAIASQVGGRSVAGPEPKCCKCEVGVSQVGEQSVAGPQKVAGLRHFSAFCGFWRRRWKEKCGPATVWAMTCDGTPDDLRRPGRCGREIPWQGPGRVRAREEEDRGPGGLSTPGPVKGEGPAAFGIFSERACSRRKCPKRCGRGRSERSERSPPGSLSSSSGRGGSEKTGPGRGGRLV